MRDEARWKWPLAGMPTEMPLAGMPTEKNATGGNACANTTDGELRRRCAPCKCTSPLALSAYPLVLPAT